jgi:multidrug efflux pump subunit AcrA (membrane-fusion protein)
MELRSIIGQKGVSLTGLIFVLAILGVIAVLGMKVGPTVAEYMSVKKAIVSAKAAGTTPAEVRTSFDKQAEVGYIDSINGKDLQIVKNGDVLDVSFAYQKIIPLVGPTSLLIDYQGSTSPTISSKKKPAE